MSCNCGIRIHQLEEELELERGYVKDGIDACRNYEAHIHELEVDLATAEGGIAVLREQAARERDRALGLAAQIIALAPQVLTAPFESETGVCPGS